LPYSYNIIIIIIIIIIVVVWPKKGATCDVF